MPVSQLYGFMSIWRTRQFPARASGSLGFADPENRLAFAYVMKQMAPGVMPNEKSLFDGGSPL
jgi:hypothetical protein